MESFFQGNRAVVAAVEMVISVVDLLKAELRLSRAAIFRLWVALLLVSAAGIFLVAALVLALIALYTALLAVMPLPFAILFTAMVSLIIAAMLAWMASQRNAR